MTKLREAAQQALEALEIGHDSAKAEADQYHAAMSGYKPARHAAMDADVQKIAQAITALRAALEQPEQEPVDELHRLLREEGHLTNRQAWELTEKVAATLYTHPPRRKWRGLTDEEREQAAGWSVEHIEAALKEKNQ